MIQLKNNIVPFKIETHSQEWYDFRTVGIEEYPGGIGASEISKLLGLDQYRPTLMELYNQKIGMEPISKNDNQRMFFGRALEMFIVRLWECWDGSEEGFMKVWGEVQSGRKPVVRESIDVNCYLVNMKFPWLFVSLDAAMKPSAINQFTGEPVGEEAPVECKTIQYFHAKQWEAGIPIKYVAQANQQMLVTETNYCEMPVLMDGSNFKVHPFKRDEELCQRILDVSKRFWYERVLPGRQYKKFYDKALLDGNKEYEEKALGKMQMLEPDPDDSEAYKEYLSERYQKEQEQMRGTISQYRDLKKHKFLGLLIKNLQKIRLSYTNSLTNDFVKARTEKMDFGLRGYAHYYKKKNATRFQMDNRLRYDPDDEIIKDIMKSIDLDEVTGSK